MTPNDFDTNKDSYALPEGYFEAFEVSLADQLELERLLGGKVEAGFSTPDAYFESVADRMASPALKTIYTARKTRKLSNWSNLSLYGGLSIAAALILLISLIGLPKQEPSLSFESLDMASIVAYMTTESYNMHTSELSSLLTEEAINELSTTSEVLTDEILIDYLEDIDNLYQLSIE